MEQGINDVVLVDLVCVNGTRTVVWRTETDDGRRTTGEVNRYLLW